MQTEAHEGRAEASLTSALLHAQATTGPPGLSRQKGLRDQHYTGRVSTYAGDRSGDSVCHQWYTVPL